MAIIPARFGLSQGVMELFHSIGIIATTSINLSPVIQNLSGNTHVYDVCKRCCTGSFSSILDFMLALKQVPVIDTGYCL